MTQAIIYLNDELNKKIDDTSKELKISKHDLIIKILESFDYGKPKFRLIGKHLNCSCNTIMRYYSKNNHILALNRVEETEKKYLSIYKIKKKLSWLQYSKTEKYKKMREKNYYLNHEAKKKYYREWARRKKQKLK